MADEGKKDPKASDDAGISEGKDLSPPVKVSQPDGGATVAEAGDPVEKTGLKEEVEVPEKFKSLVESIENLSALELSELVKVLEDKFGVSAAPTLAVGAPTSAGPSVGEEKDSYSVELAEAGGNKIAVIKVVREVTGQGLKDAKDMVDGAPTMLKENVPTKEAEEIKAKVEEAGGKVNLK